MGGAVRVSKGLGSSDGAVFVDGRGVSCEGPGVAGSRTVEEEDADEEEEEEDEEDKDERDVQESAEGIMPSEMNLGGPGGGGGRVVDHMVAEAGGRQKP